MSVSLPNTNGGLIKIETTNNTGEWQLTVGTATPIISDAKGSFDATKLSLARRHYSAISENKPQKNVIESIIKIVTAIQIATTPDKANRSNFLVTAFSRAKTELKKQLDSLNKIQFYSMYANANDIDKFFTEQGFDARNTYRSDVQEGMEATKSVADAAQTFIALKVAPANMIDELAKICGDAGPPSTLTHLAIDELQKAVTGQAVQPAVPAVPAVQAGQPPPQQQQQQQQGAGQQPADLTARKQIAAAAVITTAKAENGRLFAVDEEITKAKTKASTDVKTIVDLKTAVDDDELRGGPETLPAQASQAQVGQALRAVGQLYAAAAAAAAAVANNALARGGGGDDVNATDVLYVNWFTAYAEVAIVAAAAYDAFLAGGARKNTRRRSYGRGGRRKSHRRRRHY